MNSETDGYDIALTTIVVAVASWAMLEAISFARLASFFPIFAAGGTLLFGILHLGLKGWAYFVRRSNHDHGSLAESDTQTRKSYEPKSEFEILQTAPYLLLVVAYAITIWLMGLPIATAIFLTTTLRFLGQRSWAFSMVAMLVTMTMLYAMTRFLNVTWPQPIWS